MDRQTPLFSSGEAHAVYDAEWEQAKDCLHALKKLAQSGILTISNLRGQTGQWLAWREGCLRSCGLSKLEHQALLAWLDRVTIASASATGQAPDRTLDKLTGSGINPQDAHVNCMSLPAPPSIDLPPCICGVATSLAAHDLVNLEYSTPQASLSLISELAAISDEDLAKELCRVRAIVPVTLDSIREITVECLVPLSALAPSMTRSECIIVQDLDAQNLSNQFAVLKVAFLRDCMKDACAETLGEACRMLLVTAKQDVVTSELFMHNVVISCSSQQQAESWQTMIFMFPGVVTCSPVCVVSWQWTLL